MAQKTSNYKSSKGNDYEVFGSDYSGYIAHDKSTNQKSVYRTESKTEMHNHIENVESGKSTDLKGFGNH